MPKIGETEELAMEALPLKRTDYKDAATYELYVANILDTYKNRQVRVILNDECTFVGLLCVERIGSRISYSLGGTGSRGAAYIAFSVGHVNYMYSQGVATPYPTIVFGPQVTPWRNNAVL